MPKSAAKTVVNDQNPPKLSKGERTASRIMDVAERIFADKGYDAASLREIAQEVGIQEPGLYRHFSSKEDLYHNVLERALRPLADTLEGLLSESEISIEQLSELPGVMIDLLAQHPHMGSLFQRAVLQKKDGAGNIMQQWLENLLAGGQALLKHDDRLNSVDMALRTVNLFNLCTGYFASAQLVTQLSGKDALSEEVLTEQKRFLQAMTNRWISKNE